MATVRVFTFSGMISAPVASYSGQKSENAVWVLRLPYIANETLTPTTGSAATSSSAQFDDANTKLMKVEVEQGKRCYYEVTPKDHDLRTATASSPVIYGEEVIHFGPGWRISLLEVS